MWQVEKMADTFGKNGAAAFREAAKNTPAEALPDLYDSFVASYNSASRKITPEQADKINRMPADLRTAAYQAGIEEDTQYIEQYGDLKKFIQDQKISISETDRQDIADYNLFRKAAMGTLTISKDGLPVDVAYQQLQEMAPELLKR